MTKQFMQEIQHATALGFEPRFNRFGDGRFTIKLHCNMCGLGYILDVSIHHNEQSYHIPEPAYP